MRKGSTKPPARRTLTRERAEQFCLLVEISVGLLGLSHKCCNVRGNLRSRGSLGLDRQSGKYKQREFTQKHRNLHQQYGIENGLPDQKCSLWTPDRCGSRLLRFNNFPRPGRNPFWTTCYGSFRSMAMAYQEPLAQGLHGVS